VSRERAYRVTTGYAPTAGGTSQARHERESIIDTAVSRLSRLDLGDRSLVFGRIDFAAPEDGADAGGDGAGGGAAGANVPVGADGDTTGADGAGAGGDAADAGRRAACARDDAAGIDARPAAGERFYIGRVGVWDDAQDTVVVDWRAPVAEPFYRATGREPLGLERRRHFATRGRSLLAIDDEVFGGLARSQDRPVSGEGALIAAMEAARTGRLGDIVGTIQGEQDEVIRAPLPGVLLVQGGPGTGKTVVALHRAAYLLYTHRFPLEGQGVLVIGPNRLFLSYIEQVLPSLGEAGVEISVLADLLSPRVRADGFDDEPTALVKGDLRMREVLARAVRDRQRSLREDFRLGFGVQRLRLSVEESRQIVAEARRRARGHNSGRKVVEKLVFAALADSANRAAARRTRSGRSVAGSAGGFRRVEAETLREQLSHETAVRELLDWMWPVLTPAQLLHDLFGSQALLRSANRSAAGKALFADDEIERLHRERTARAGDVTWRFSDVALLDEARALLGARPGKADADAVRTYGHICIDEAQDLSPMELRMIRRRSLNGSMTVVGDIAQATGAWALDNWGQLLELLAPKQEASRRELTIGYRIPGPTMTLANRVLRRAAPGLTPPRPVRSQGDPARVVPVPGLGGPELAGLVRAELEAVSEGNVAVIVSASVYPLLREALERHGLEFGAAGRHGLGHRVTLVPVRLVKGLEVDSALVVEPARILRDERQGVRALYVALTRATKRVAVVHAEPLPDLLLQ